MSSGEIESADVTSAAAAILVHNSDAASRCSLARRRRARRRAPRHDPVHRDTVGTDRAAGRADRGLQRRALVRFGPPVLGEPGARRQGDEQGQTLPLPGTVYERVLATQQLDVRTLEDGVHLTVPVTDRGDAIGVLELTLPRHPDQQRSPP
jgi:hypothetical protein